MQDYPDGVLLALDQMSLYFQATTTRVWSPCGQTPTLRVATQRDHVHFYGALNLRSGQEVALPVPQQASEITCHFLDHLQSIYPQQALFILWDRAKWHQGQALHDYLVAHPHLHTLHFPPGSPQLNPQEHVWSLARHAISHNHTFHHFPNLVHTFHHYLESTDFHLNWLDKYVPPTLLAT